MPCSMICCSFSVRAVFRSAFKACWALAPVMLSSRILICSVILRVRSRYSISRSRTARCISAEAPELPIKALAMSKSSCVFLISSWRDWYWFSKALTAPSACEDKASWEEEITPGRSSKISDSFFAFSTDLPSCSSNLGIIPSTTEERASVIPFTAFLPNSASVGVVSFSATAVSKSSWKASFASFLAVSS